MSIYPSLMSDLLTTESIYLLTNLQPAKKTIIKLHILFWAKQID